MDILAIRSALRNGQTIAELPLRVTYYARVSTDRDEQRNSLENQVQYYTSLIGEHRVWQFVPGYIDEGISGTSTRGRDGFLQMIRDAKDGRFDFIITKEISRFSRSTLDSIHFTQELLEHGVGVLFQNDNINTLDPDSEFRLVIMAAVAQDEVRKLSERLKFGFRQAIQNGHVLGNDRLWGYDKSGCVLRVNEPEAAIVRRIFDLYANQQLGIRRISQTLLAEGITSREGNAFNVVTIRHILCNPKYKGWYCGGKSHTLDYRSKRKVLLDETRWVSYPDPSVPAIVPEALWDRANALYRARSRRAREHTTPGSFSGRYAYSGKIVCEVHGTSYHRQICKTASGGREVWQCRVYRERGRAGCTAPQLRSEELTRILSEALRLLLPNRQAVAEAIWALLSAVPEPAAPQPQPVREAIAALQAKKDRLLELSIAGVVSVEEFQRRNDGFNAQLRTAEEKLTELTKASAQQPFHTQTVRRALDALLRMDVPLPSTLASAVLRRVVVGQQSSRDTLYLTLHFTFGCPVCAVFSRRAGTLRFLPTAPTALSDTPPAQNTGASV